jgi:hypothetical protein
VPVGALGRQAPVDVPQAPLRLTYVTSGLDVRTVVSPAFDRPGAYEARYRLSVRVDSRAVGSRPAWIERRGEGRSLASATRSTDGAITQAVRALYSQIRAVGGAVYPKGGR